MGETSINALVQSIERSLLLIHKNIFSIKQYHFPQKIRLNLFKESRRTSPLCVRRQLRLYIHLPPDAYGNISTYQMFFSGVAGVMNTVSVTF